MKSTLTVNLQFIKDNYNYLRGSTNAKIAAAVKANAYGLGADKVSNALYKEGCRDFFVANAEEGVELTETLSSDANIYVLHGIADETVDYFAEHRLIPALSNSHQIEIWSNHHPDKKCVIHIDTGMNRLGMNLTDFASIFLPNNVEYIMSHLACDGDVKSLYNKYQLDNFIRATSKCPNVKRSLAASGGIFLGKDYHFDMVRSGAALYGIGSLKNRQLKNPITLTAPIMHINKCNKKEYVGYGSSAEVKAGTLIATIPIGYGDGYSRFLSNQGVVFINGKPAKILGRISMDLTTIDVTDMGVKIGDKVEIIGEHNTPDHIASVIGTIGYEIITSLNYGRFNRVYIDN